MDSMLLWFVIILLGMTVVAIVSLSKSEGRRSAVCALVLVFTALFSSSVMEFHTRGIVSRLQTGDSHVYQVVSVYQDISDSSRAVALLRNRNGEERHYQVNLNRFEGGIEDFLTLSRSTCFSLIPYDAKPTSLLTIVEVACGGAIATGS